MGIRKDGGCSCYGIRLLRRSTLLLLLLLVLLLEDGVVESFSSPQTVTQIPPPTTTSLRRKDDKAVHEFYQMLGILCPNLKVRTTEESIGGRGVFFVGNENTGGAEAAANVGDLLAYIPHEALLALSPSTLDSSANDCNVMQWIQESKQLEWPMKLAVCALLQTNSKELLSTWDFREEGMIPGYYYSNKEDVSKEELECLAKMAGCNNNMIDLVQKAIDIRRDDFESQLEILLTTVPALEEILTERAAAQQQSTPTNNHDDDKDYWKELLGQVYGCILSRAIQLSHLQEQSQHCVVPLHDMINHCNDFDKVNFGIYSIGRIRQMIPNPTLLQNRLAEQLNLDATTREMIQDNDLCLVATKPIPIGSELLNSYTGPPTTEEQPTMERRIWKLLQYGFPLA